MRVLYVAPRYHTNQIPVMKGWLENGHKVLFLSQFAGTSEDYTILRPVILGYSALFEIVMRIYVFLFCRNEKSAKKEYDLRIKAGFPPLGKAASYIRRFKPDLVIVRERSLYNVPFTLACRRRGIPCILYNQSPLWDKPDRDKDWKKRLLLRFLPRKRMTPVLGKPNGECVILPDAAFVPFVMEPYCLPEEKEHFLRGHINVLCVARYEKRKNLFLLIEALHDLIFKYDLCLTIAGEAVDANQKEYYEKLQKYILKCELQDNVLLRKNLTRKEVYQEYKRSDIFVLPSTRERASITQLEAMSCCLPVICSDTNGSACYVEEGITGYLFHDNDKEALREKMEKLVRDKGEISLMSKAAWKAVMEKYQFAQYYDRIVELMKE